MGATTLMSDRLFCCLHSIHSAPEYANAYKDSHLEIQERTPTQKWTLGESENDGKDIDGKRFESG